MNGAMNGAMEDAFDSGLNILLEEVTQHNGGQIAGDYLHGAAYHGYGSLYDASIEGEGAANGAWLFEIPNRWEVDGRWPETTTSPDAAWVGGAFGYGNDGGEVEGYSIVDGFGIYDAPDKAEEEEEEEDEYAYAEDEDDATVYDLNRYTEGVVEDCTGEVYTWAASAQPWQRDAFDNYAVRGSTDARAWGEADAAGTVGHRLLPLVGEGSVTHAQRLGLAAGVALAMWTAAWYGRILR